MATDGSILCCSRIVDLSIHSEHSTESTGYLQFLPGEHLSGYDCQHKSIQHFKSRPSFPTRIFSAEICDLGERTLVLELGD